MTNCLPSRVLQRWCRALQEEERSQSLMVPGSAEERPVSSAESPPGLTAGLSCAPQQHGARHPKDVSLHRSPPLLRVRPAGPWLPALGRARETRTML